MNNLQIVVGSKDCPVTDVWSIVWKCPVLHDQWSTIARGLGIDEFQIKEFRHKLQLDKITYSDLIFELLQLWVASTGHEATLAALLHVLEEECHSVKVGESLRARFKLRGTSPKRKYIAMGHSIPDRPTYYIDRTLITRNLISYDIFEHNSEDIFLFKGMDRSELTKLVKNKLTGVSREQITCAKIEPRFIVLKADHHFDQICAKTDKPVHLLRKEDSGRLRWIKSNGDITYLQGCIIHSQDELDEESFCQILATQKDPVCISDSPGMGKSLLLAEIGSRLTRMFPKRSVFFVTLTEFMSMVKQLGTDNKTQSISGAFKILFDWTISKAGPNSEEEQEISFELLLDGFDELDSKDHHMAYDLLKEIKHSFQSIRIWVTSRPHLLGELELHLRQLGFNIRAFQIDDQVKFLTSYWTRKKQLDLTKCHQFAKHCLEVLKSKMSSTDRDIAGIPLQCLLIGESYEKEAVEFARTDNANELLEVDLDFGTISNLYRSLIKKKIHTYSSKNGTSKFFELELMTIHAKLGWAIIFSDVMEDLASDPVGRNEMEQVLKVGILESSSTSQSARFLHRTFAEYFVAWHVVEELGKTIISGEPLPKSFLRVLESQGQIEMQLTSFKFTYPVITYFIDSFIADPASFSSYSSPVTLSEEFIRGIAHSCVNANYGNIFKLLLRLNILGKQADNIVNQKFVYLTIWNSSLEVLKPALRIFEQYHEFDFTVQVETIRTAIKRGKYSILEYLLKEKSLLCILKELTGEETDFMHDCVENSKNDSVMEIEQKVLIIRMLLQINPPLLRIKGGLWQECPLLSFGVHIRLLTELIILRADVNAQDMSGNTVLHMNYHRSHLSSKEYHDLVLILERDNLKRLVQLNGEGEDLPLMTIIRWIDPMPETLIMFKDAGASFNAVDADKDSILEIAIRNGRATNKLIEFGAKINRKPQRWLREKLGVVKKSRGRKTLLHHAAENGNLEAVNLLLDDKRMYVNAKDEDGMTPMTYATRQASSTYGIRGAEHLDVTMLLESCGGVLGVPLACQNILRSTK